MLLDSRILGFTIGLSSFVILSPALVKVPKSAF